MVLLGPGLREAECDGDSPSLPPSVVPDRREDGENRNASDAGAVPFPASVCEETPTPAGQYNELQRRDSNNNNNIHVP